MVVGLCMAVAVAGPPLEVDAARVEASVRALAGADEVTALDPKGQLILSRHVLHDDHDLAVAWLVAELEGLGLSPWIEPVSAEGRDDLGNVVVDLPSTRPDDPLLVVGAHLDSTASFDDDDGFRPSHDPAPGADDDASGCAALLELARLLRDRPLAAPVRLVWFDAHEVGLEGSLTHVDGLIDEGREVAAMWSLDPIGSGGPDDELWVTWDARWPTGARELLSLDTSLTVRTLHAASVGGGASSDHTPFQDAEMPALHVAGAPPTPRHHTAYDEVDALDFDYLAEVTRLVGEHVLLRSEPAAEQRPGGGCSCGATEAPRPTWLRLFGRR